MAPSKRYILTFQSEQVCQYTELPPELEYLLVGPLEHAPTTGAAHRHGLIIFKKKQRPSAVRRLFPNVHFETVRGTLTEARDYCLKEGGPAHLELGSIDLSEKKKISDKVALALKDTSLRELFDMYPGYVMNNYLKLEAMQARMAKWESKHTPRTVIWIYGDTGVGKTRYGSELFPDAPILDYVDPFMHGYNLEKVVILDELRYDVPLRTLLRLTDRYRYTVNVKNGSLPWLAETIIVTAPEPPQGIYTTDRGCSADNVQQLLRRLSCVVRLTDSYVQFDHPNSGERLSRSDGLARLSTYLPSRN